MKKTKESLSLPLKPRMSKHFQAFQIVILPFPPPKNVSQDSGFPIRCFDGEAQPQATWTGFSYLRRSSGEVSIPTSQLVGECEFWQFCMAPFSMWYIERIRCVKNDSWYASEMLVMEKHMYLYILNKCVKYIPCLTACLYALSLLKWYGIRHNYLAPG